MVRTEGGADGHVTIKISRMREFPKFSYPWLATGKLRYTSFNYHLEFLEVKVKIVIQKEFKRTM